MAILASPEASGGILSAVRGAFGLFDKMNKAEGVDENMSPIPIDEYESSLSDLEIVELIGKWKRVYSVYFTEIDKSQKLSFDYWVGRHRADDASQTNKNIPDATDNLIFEAIETFLPIATRANPDPLVSADPSDLGQKLAKDIKVTLVNWADTQKLRRKLAMVTRQWALYRIGVGKLWWDPKTKEIKFDVINPKRMIFDKDGYVDAGGHFIGEYLGEKKKKTADVLMEMFPKKKEEIKIKANNKMGTQIEFYEWWYQGTDVFYTMDETVLGKYKNPNWNYDGKVKTVDPTTGAETETEIQGTNHLKEMDYPYMFLSIFSTSQQPHDETSLVMQNISIQDMINRRWKQIDNNVNGMNNGIVVSGTSFTEEQASQAASALRRGMAIRVPNGKVGDAVQRFSAPALPNDVFNSLRDARMELRNLFGTSGSTPEGQKAQESVRGKILINQMDASRIGGGITEVIEQVADTIYNYVVQMMFVYYDEEHFITTAGATGGMELITIKNSAFQFLKTLSITVKEGSLIPKDPMTQRNQAIDLWSAGAIDPLNLFKALDLPDPVDATKQLILWQLLQKGAIQPQMYLPSFATPTQPGMAPGGVPPQGVGGQAVNSLGPPEQAPPPPVATPEAVTAQSQQLMRSVPIK